MSYKEPAQGLLIPIQNSDAQSGLTLAELWRAFVRLRASIVIVALLTIVVGVAAYSMTDRRFTASSTVVITDSSVENSVLGAARSQLGSLAGFAGVSLGGNAGHRAEAIATLESRDLIRRFISDNNLLPLLYADDWDGSNDTWLTDTGNAPTLEQATTNFRDNILQIERDPGSDVVEISITWFDPVTSAEWANGFVSLANSVLRARAADEATRIIEFLEREIDNSSNVELRSSIYSLLQEQMGRIMWANVRTEFAFQVVDRAVPPDPDNHVSPRLLYIAAAMVGMILLFSVVAIPVQAILLQSRSA